MQAENMPKAVKKKIGSGYRQRFRGQKIAGTTTQCLYQRVLFEWFVEFAN